MGGRPLRIDLADSDPFLEGKTTVRGELIDGGTPGPSEPRHQWRGGRDDARVHDPHSILPSLPPGIQIPNGSSALDYISQSLASMQPSQLMEVLAQMKVKDTIPALSNTLTERITPSLGIRYYASRTSKNFTSGASSTRIRALPGVTPQ